MWRLKLYYNYLIKDEWCIVELQHFGGVVFFQIHLFIFLLKYYVKLLFTIFSPLFNYTTNFLLKSECWNDIKEQGYLCLYTQLLLMTRLNFSFFGFFLSLSIRSALDARASAFSQNFYSRSSTIVFRDREEVSRKFLFSRRKG